MEAVFSFETSVSFKVVDVSISYLKFTSQINHPGILSLNIQVKTHKVPYARVS
jgi:hypothetical protein